MEVEELEFDVWWTRLKKGRPDLEALHLVGIEGYSLNEAAAILGISKQAVRTRIERARTFLAATCLKSCAQMRAVRGIGKAKG